MTKLENLTNLAKIHLDIGFAFSKKAGDSNPKHGLVQRDFSDIEALKTGIGKLVDDFSSTIVVDQINDGYES